MFMTGRPPFIKLATESPGTMENPVEIHFNDWTLLRASGELLHLGRRIRLQDHPLKVLDALLERPGVLVTREQLIARLWPNQVVDFDTALNTAVRRLRAALGDDAGTPRYIETIPRRGYRFIGQLESGAAPLPVTGPAVDEPVRFERRRLRAGFVAAAAVLVVLGGGWLAARESPTREATAIVTPGTIVVLPFVDLSPDEGNRLFADGLTEELINRLAGTEGMRVVARTSSFAIRNRGLDIRGVAETLGVSHVLEGSVRRSGDQVRVTAQLIDTTDSTHVWSQNYDRTMGDLFEIQDDIASHVATALEIRMDPQATAERRPDPAAYERYLVARHLFGRRGAGDVEKARDYFEEATEIDPAFARAWAGLASAYSILVAEGTIDHDRGLAQLEQAANRALSLNTRLAEPHIRLALMAYATGDAAANREHWRQAIELDPEEPLVKLTLAQRAARRNHAGDGVALGRLAVELDPLSVVARHNLSAELYATGRYEESLVEARKALELSPSHSRVIACHSLVQLGRFAEARALAEAMPEGAVRLQCLAMADHGLGNRTQSDAALRELVASFRGTEAFMIAETHAFRGDLASAFDWLRRTQAYCATAGNAPWLFECIGLAQEYSPFLAPLRADPRWVELGIAGGLNADRAAASAG